MSWNDRLLSVEELLVVDNNPTGATLSEKAKALLKQQAETWPILREAVAAADQVEYKKFSVKGSDVLAQFNPKRIVSTGAKVDAATIQKRPCFLCVENLPAEEKGISFGDDLVVLCNPFPVLRDHLVISSRRHTPQTIAGNIGAMLDLSRDFGSEWFTLYNGPRCGASAPDHLHFQACPRTGVPLFADFSLQTDRKRSKPESAGIYDYRIKLMIGCGGNREQMISWFNRAIEHLSSIVVAESEPMINLIVTYQQGQWTIFIMPRGKHRPECYYAEGDAKLTISPAAIDLAGVMVVPEPEHFARITAEDIERIYDEVTFDRDLLIEWILKVNSDKELEC